MATEEKKSDAKAPAGRFQIGPSIDKLLAIPPNLEGLTPLQASDCFIKSEEFYVGQSGQPPEGTLSESERRLWLDVSCTRTLVNSCALDTLRTPAVVTTQSQA